METNRVVVVIHGDNNLPRHPEIPVHEPPATHEPSPDTAPMKPEAVLHAREGRVQGVAPVQVYPTGA